MSFRGHPQDTQATEMEWRERRFVWVVSAPDLAVARAELQRLTAAVVALIPEAAAVLVTAQGGVQILDDAGDSLDVATVPSHLAEEVAVFFGLGVYTLPGPGRAGCRIERPYRASSGS